MSTHNFAIGGGAGGSGTSGTSGIPHLTHVTGTNVFPIGATDFAPFDPCLGGHVVEGEAVEYYDGVIVSNCSRCHCRIVLPSVPGGVSFLRVQTLLGAVMALDEHNSSLPGFDLASILELLIELRDAVEEETFAVDEARRLIGLAQQILEQKVQTTLAT